MASSDVSAVTNHFSTAAEGFTTTLSSTISSGATTVPLTSVSGLTNGKIFVGIIEPGTVGKEQTFTGTVDTAGNQITGVKWTRGSNTGHNAGVTIVDYVSGTGHNMMTKGLLVEHDQDGTHSAITASSITATSGTFTNLTIAGTASTEGWAPLGATPDTITANGNRSYDMVFNSNDLTDTLSPGMRLKATRTVTAPTQCADLESSSSHYFSKTSPSGVSFTTTFTCAAWIKLESYVAGGIIARRNADTEGWSFAVNTSGQLEFQGIRIAANYKSLTSNQSIPLNKWVHVAATMDVAAGDTSAQKIWIDGVEVPRSYTLTGTCAALVQGTTALVVGARKSAGTDPFDGKIAQAAVFSACLADATIKAMATQTLSGSETNLVSAFSLNNTLNDLNTGNANNLTAQNSAVATNADSPFAGGSVGTTEYGIVTAAAFSTNTTLTVQVPEGYALPTTGGISAVSYSINKIPYGFPVSEDKWHLSSFVSSTTSPAMTASFKDINFKLVAPVGVWDISLQANQVIVSVAAQTDVYWQHTLSTDAATVTDERFRIKGRQSGASSTQRHTSTIARSVPQTVTSATTYSVITLPEAGAQLSSILLSDGEIKAKFALL